MLVSTLPPSCLNPTYRLVAVRMGILTDPKVAGNLELEINLPLLCLGLLVLLRIKIEEIETQEQAVISQTLEQPQQKWMCGSSLTSYCALFTL